MKIRDRKLANRVVTLLPGVRAHDDNYCYSDTWRLAARSAIFRQLNAIEDAAMEVNAEQREALISQAIDNVGAMLSYLELSHLWLQELAAAEALQSMRRPENRMLQMGRAG